MAPNEPMLGTPLDDLIVDAFPSTRSPQEEAPAADPILSIDEFTIALDRLDDAAFACGEWTRDDDESYQSLTNEQSARRAAVYDAYAELLLSYESLAKRSAEEADRAQVLVLRKDEELAAHDDLHRQAAHRIEQLVRQLAITNEALDGSREIIRRALATMREPVTHTDARRAREILQHYHHECAVAAVRARRETAPFPTAPGASL